MNTQIILSNTKGEEKLELILTPSTNLEREFFNAIITNNGVHIEQMPNSDDIIIKKSVTKDLSK